MARSFATNGDRVVAASFTIPTAISFYCWVKNPSTFRIFYCFGSDNLRCETQASTVFRFSRVFATSGFTTTNVTHGLTLSNWNHVCWTHDGTTALPTYYGNGVSVAHAAWGAAGAVSLGSSSFTLGANHTGDDTSQIGGPAAYFGFHNVVLTVGEVNDAMRHGYTPRGLIGFWPMFGDSPEPDLSGLLKTGTVSGTTVVAGPPTSPYLPARPW